MKATDNGKVVFGLLVKSIKVLAVVDSNGNDVFSSTNPGAPAELLFSVSDDYYSLLSRASYISGITLVPVPRNSAYTSEGSETEIPFEELKAFIDSKSSLLTN